MYMAHSHKDWELPNSQILAEIDFESGLDFSSRLASRLVRFGGEKTAN